MRILNTTPTGATIEFDGDVHPKTLWLNSMQLEFLKVIEALFKKEVPK